MGKPVRAVLRGLGGSNPAWLPGQVVRVVWVQFEAEDSSLGATRVLLATEAGLRPEVVIKAYARRWPIEPLFNQLRHGWGWLDAWQQSRQVLARWVQRDLPVGVLDS